MKKINISKVVNVPKLIHRMFILLWVVLGFCLIGKYLFHQWYPIVSHNETYLNICNYVDETKWLYYMITYNSFMITDFLWILIASRKIMIKNFKVVILVNLLLTACYIVKSYNMLVGNILELTSLICVPMIFNLRDHRFTKTWLNIVFPIIVYGIINLWQLNILLIRDVNEILSDAPTLMWLTIQIDYYLFIIILYGEVNSMGLLGGWFFGKSETELLAIKEKELKKANPDAKVLEEVNKRLEELRNEAA